MTPLKPHFYIIKLGFTGVYIIFHISAKSIDCGYSLEPPRRGGSNEYPQSMFLNRKMKNNIYPCKPQFYYIKVGFKGVKIIYACFRDESVFVLFLQAKLYCGTHWKHSASVLGVHCSRGEGGGGVGR